ncbi:MFS transporter [Chloroflexota bacterium]
MFFIANGTFFHSYGVFLPVMSIELGWTRSSLGLGMSLTLITFALSSPLVGASITKFGPRKNIILGNMLTALGMFGMSQCQELWQLYLFFGVFIGLGTGFGTFLACTTLINKWFVSRRYFYMSLIFTAGGLAGFVFPPLTSSLIISAGWQTTWLIFGCISLIFSVLVGGLVLIRNAPEDSTPLPYEETFQTSQEFIAGDVLDKGIGTKSILWHLNQTIKKPAFWLITLIGATNYYALGTITSHQIAYLKDIGFPAMIAALVFSLLSGMSVIGRIGFGVLALRINLKKLIIASFIIQLSAFVILLTTHNISLIYLYAILFGVSCGALIVAFPAYVAEYFGSAHYAQIMGFALPLVLLVEAAGPAISGLIYDTTTQYTIAFVLLIIISSLGLLSITLLRPRRLT